MTSFDMTWDDVKTGNRNVNFLTRESGKAGNLMRIVSKPSVIEVHWEDSYEDGTKKAHKINCLGAKCVLCEHGSKPRHRYQLLVIDKSNWSREDGYGSDGPQVKVLETGISVMKQIKTYATDPEYGDPTTYDIKIKKEGSGKETRYAVVPSPKTIPLTEEEKDAVENSPTLKDLNKMLTESEIVALNLNILSDMTADDVEGSESESDSDTKDEDGEWDNFD